jgi:hypothetical protein
MTLIGVTAQVFDQRARFAHWFEPGRHAPDLAPKALRP